MMKTKRNFKRVISLLLAILMATSTLAGLNLTAFADTNTGGNFDGFSDAQNCKWSYDSSTQTITIEPIDSNSEETCKMPNFTYDYSFDEMGMTVTSDCPWSTINDFKYTISQAVIKCGVTNIGDYAFYECKNLTTVDLRSDATSLTSIGKSTFYNTAITSITIPSTVETIGEMAFYGCKSLETVDLSDATSLTTIGDDAFCYCYNLDKVTFANKDVTIGDDAFFGCPSDLVVYAPAGGSVQQYCTDNSIKFEAPEVITADGTCGNNCSWKLNDQGTLTVYPTDDSNNAKMTDYSNSSNTPWNSYLEYIKKVIVKGKVTNVGDYAFCNCTSLSTVDLSNATSLTSIGDNSFRNTAITSITIPSTVETISTYAFAWCESLSKVDLSNLTSLTSISDFSFQHTAITSITIPSNVETIGNDAFDHCSNLNKVTFANKDVTIGSWGAFNNCSSDLVITAPAGGSVQQYCTDNSIKFRDSSIVADGTCGTNCSWKLNDQGTLTVYPTDGINDATMNNYLLVDKPWTNYKGDIKKVVIKDKVTNIGVDNFAMCSSLETVDLSDATSLTTIGMDAFSNSGITSITIPSTVETIGIDAFFGCESLETVDLTDATSLTTIGMGAFYGTAITSITIPSNVETIDGRVFEKCSKLNKVTFANKDVSIGDSAFSSCSSDLVVYSYAGGTVETYCTTNNITFKAFADYDAYSSALKLCKDKQKEEDYATKYTEESRIALDTAVDKYSNKSNTETYIDINNLYAEQTDINNATTALQTALNDLKEVVSEVTVKFNVFLDGEQQGETDGKTLKVGTKQSFIIPDDIEGNVYKWTVEQNETTNPLLTDKKSIDLTISGDMTVNVYLSSDSVETESTTKVTYLSRNASVLEIKYVQNGTAIDMTGEDAEKAPTVSFYTFKEWKVVSGNPSKPDGKDIVLRAIYDIDGVEANYTNVHCLGNVKANGQTDLKIFYDKCVALTGSSKDAKFAFVTANGNTVLSAIQGNIIYAPHCKDVYIKEVTEQNASTTITGMYSNKEGTNNHFTMNCMAFVPDDATMVECGIIATVRDDVASGDNFVIGTDKVNKFTSPTQSKAGEFSMEFVGDFTGTEFTKFYCRSFVTYTQNGAEHTVYSNVSSAQVQ